MNNGSIGFWSCLIGSGVLILLGVSACADKQRQQPPMAATPKAMSRAEFVERGKYLVTIGGCSDCHTPLTMTEKGPMPDMTKYLSGHPQGLKLPQPPAAQGPWIWGGAATNTAFYGPWGVTYSANLTPDEHTGMGIWTEQMFVHAMRTGKHFGQPAARAIQPPMPWNFVGQMTDEDLKAVYAYLRSVPAIKNLVPDYVPPSREKS